MTRADAFELARIGGYALPEVAGALLYIVTNTADPEEQLRALRAVEWLDLSNPLPIAARTGDSMTETLCLGIARGLVEVLTTAGRQDRSRIGKLLEALLSEVERISKRQPRERAV